LAEDVISLLKDMSDGSLGGQWPEVTKGAVAENILALTKLEGSQRESSECLGLPVVWMALASLCVLDQAAHVDGLTSKAAVQTTRPFCDNHDDGETLAIISCDSCGNLCGDCDR